MIILNLEIDPNHSEAGLQFDGNRYLTDEPRVRVFPRYDSLEDVSMMIQGDVMESEDTYKLIPFKPSAEVILNSSQGTRIVEVIFFEAGEEVARSVQHIYSNQNQLSSG